MSDVRLGCLTYVVWPRPQILGEGPQQASGTPTGVPDKALQQVTTALTGSETSAPRFLPLW